MFGRKFEVLTIFRRQGRNIEFCIRQVDAFLCTKLGSALGGVGDLYFEPRFAAYLVDLTDDTLNLSVVKENSLAGLRISGRPPKVNSRSVRVDR